VPRSGTFEPIEQGIVGKNGFEDDMVFCVCSDEDHSTHY
jgi:hypothetical protein